MSPFEDFAYREWVREAGGPIQVTCLTSATSVTALVPAAGNELRVYFVNVDSPNFSAPVNVKGVRVIDA